MATAPTTAKAAKGAKTTPWAAALEKGVEGWSSFTETGSGEDNRTEDGSREVVDSARVRAGLDAAASAGAPVASGPAAAKSGGDGKSADAKSGGGTGAAAASGGDGKEASGGGDANAKKSADAKGGDGGAGGKRAALDQGWRQYRRDVEWQCRWLELRMKEIDGHVDRYQRMLDGIERAKRKGGADEKDAEPVTTSGEPETTPLDGVAATRMKRRREHQGDTPPPNPVLGTHPLFVPDDEAFMARMQSEMQAGARKPEKLTAAQRKRRKKEAAHKAALGDRGEGGNKSGSGTGSDSDLSTAALYEQIEVLQQRVTALHQRLGQPTPEMHGTGSVVAIRKNRGVPDAFGGFPQPHKPPEKLKSRKDDFDINNVVGANEGAKFVERAQHIDICTPGVRPAPTYAMAPITDERGVARAEKAKAQAEAAAAAAIVAGEGGDAEAVAEAKNAGIVHGDDSDCSSEDTSDEAYVNRHTQLEVAERKARTLPDKKEGRRGKDKNEPKAGKGEKDGDDDEESGRVHKRARKGGGGSRSGTPPTPPVVAVEPVVAEDDGEPELNSAALVG